MYYMSLETEVAKCFLVSLLLLCFRWKFILKKKQQNDICKENSEKKSESQMRFEPTTLRTLHDLVRCSNH